MNPPSHTGSVVLQPVRRWWLRLAVVLALSLLATLGSGAAMYKKAIFCGSLALWLGSFPFARISVARFERGMFVLFMPVQIKRWPNDRFTRIETDAEESIGAEAALFVGLKWWLVWRLCDLMVPWLGGPYKLWLRAASGRRVLAWQGSGERQFRANMEALRRKTGLPLERG